MRIELLSLILSNFKGIQSFSLEVKGQDAIVSGANGTGKTSIFDAWLWLLFDMDSRGAKGADAVKTTAGTDFVHYLTHEVKATISVDGKQITLRKTLAENWVKPRGKDTQEFSGNVANFWVDDVPKQVREYQSYINTLIDAECFKILSDPLYFSEQMKWSDRLNLLVEISGGITEEDVVAGDKALELLLVKMGDKSMPDFRKMTQEQIRRLNNEIESIPARIDEQNRGIVFRDMVDFDQVEKDLTVSQNEMAALEASELNAKDAMKPLLEMQDHVFRIKREREALIDLVLKEGNADKQTASEKLQLLIAIQRSGREEIDELKDELKDRQNRVDGLNADNADMRTKFTGIRAQIAELSTDEFVPPSLNEENCPTCGQKLPSDMQNEKVEELRTSFEATRLRKLDALQLSLEGINRNGKENTEKIKELLSRSDSDLKQIELLTFNVTGVASEIERLRSASSSSPVMLPAQAEQDPRVKDLDDQIFQINIKLAATPEDRSEELRTKKTAVRQEIERMQSILYSKGTFEKVQLRIAELESELKTKATTKTTLEGDIFQCERFVRARTEKLEGKINGMFTQVGFKLFAEQVNGGLSETCEAVVNNTTFSKANTAGQINAGMDIIRTVSRYMGLYVPVFVDHLESINDLLPLSSQVISLLVSREAELQVSASQSSKQEVA